MSLQEEIDLENAIVTSMNAKQPAEKEQELFALVLAESLKTAENDAKRIPFEDSIELAIAMSFESSHTDSKKCLRNAELAFLMAQIDSVYSLAHDTELDEAIRLSLKNEKTDEGKETKTPSTLCNVCCELRQSKWICKRCKYDICESCVVKTFVLSSKCPNCRLELGGSVVNGKILTKYVRKCD